MPCETQNEQRGKKMKEQDQEEMMESARWVEQMHFAEQPG